MIGILLVTHAPLGNAFIEAATHIFRQRPERLEALDVWANQDPDEVYRKATEIVARIDDGSGVLIITDVKGGTPSNCSVNLRESEQVEVVAGISLPMLLRALTYRQNSLEVVAEMALSGAQDGAVRVDNRVKLQPN